MITYSEYFDDYVKDLNKYIHKIKASIKQIIVETNSLPKGSHQIFDDIPKHQADLKKYKQLLSKMSSDYYSDEVTDETRQEQNRVKRMLLSIYHNKVLFKCLLILIIILLAIANIGVIIYKIK
ncbi:hypothetical protein PVNG_04562 [Plasmodium vivax North Korean]|uniref:Vesicle transport v-SNARE N-terminal domain-containing protein n=1 Tax=Plasmodium vivax North Korean TaxID=1035514 RepID=A0A0J9TYM1_PLAVI|nr:hypothetical protein PVNG_04562 [Plasmodium vivax North Korean]